MITTSMRLLLSAGSSLASRAALQSYTYHPNICTCTAPQPHQPRQTACASAHHGFPNQSSNGLKPALTVTVGPAIAGGGRHGAGEHVACAGRRARRRRRRRSVGAALCRRCLRGDCLLPFPPPQRLFTRRFDTFQTLTPTPRWVLLPSRVGLAPYVAVPFRLWLVPLTHTPLHRSHLKPHPSLRPRPHLRPPSPPRLSG